MTWHSFPHIPEEGADIIFLYKGCEEGNFFQKTIKETDNLNCIEKWCYRDDYYELMKRKILHEKDV